MLGEILGLSAGLARVVLTLFLFFTPRLFLGSALLPLPKAKAGLVGEATALSIGLGLPVCAANPEGVLIGVNLGVLRACICVTVDSLALSIAVSRGDVRGSEGPGSNKSSSNVSSSPTAKLGDRWRCINDAGVAGQSLWSFCWVPWANVAGECITEPGLGGGPISDRFSGETESNSEESLLRGTSSPLGGGRTGPDFCASSTDWLTSLDGMDIATAAFRRAGFTMGDCRTRAATFEFRVVVLLLVLRTRLASSGCAIAASPSISTSR